MADTPRPVRDPEMDSESAGAGAPALDPAVGQPVGSAGAAQPVAAQGTGPGPAEPIAADGAELRPAEPVAGQSPVEPVAGKSPVEPVAGQSPADDFGEFDADFRERRRGWAHEPSLFASRALWVFVARVAQFALGIGALFVIGRLLDTDGSGQFGLLQTWAGMLYALGQFGLPAAMTFFAGRGRSLVSLEHLSWILTIAASALVGAVALALLPVLKDNFLRIATVPLLQLMLLYLPAQFLLTFAGGILYARGANRPYNILLVAQSAGTLILLVVFVGGFHWGVPGAVAAFLTPTLAAAFGAAVIVHRLASRPEGRLGPDSTLPEFVGYGLKLYPQNVTSFFSYRADVFLLTAMLGSSSLVGLYNLAVKIAEATFYVPDSIATILYPAVSASDRQEANRLALSVSRFTMLATFLVAASIIPCAFVAIWVFLPHFKGSFPALVVIMPGILSLSLSKVLSSYIAGLGRPLPTAVAAIAALTINLALNIFLIPRWGIVGASTASLVSYTCHASILLTVSSRWAGVSPLAFILPGRSEFERLRRTMEASVARIRSLRAG